MRSFVLFIVLYPGLVFAKSFICPKSTVVKTKASHSDNYQVYPETSSYNLSHIKVSNGHPKNLFFIKPDPNYTRSSKEKDSFWLSCVYMMVNVTNISSEVYLIRKIPRKYTNCIHLKFDKSMKGYGLKCDDEKRK